MVLSHILESSKQKPTKIRNVDREFTKQLKV